MSFGAIKEPSSPTVSQTPLISGSPEQVQDVNICPIHPPFTDVETALVMRMIGIAGDPLTEEEEQCVRKHPIFMEKVQDYAHRYPMFFPSGSHFDVMQMEQQELNNGLLQGAEVCLRSSCEVGVVTDTQTSMSVAELLALPQLSQAVLSKESFEVLSDDSMSSVELQISDSDAPLPSPVTSLLKLTEKPYQCQICSKCFAFKENFERHLNRHKVEEASASMAVVDTLQMKHTETATSDINEEVNKREGVSTKSNKQHKCTTCGKIFARKGDLTKHERIHSGIKPYQCSICSKSFISNGALSVHLRTHSGVKPFECATCKKTFSQKVHLKLHELRHKDEKKYKSQF